MLHKDYDRKCAVDKIFLLGLKGLDTKTNWVAVSHQS
jgi:hypothetical protein